MSAEKPVRRFSVPTATLLVVASMVGTGVFTTTGYLVRDIGSLGAVLLAWLLGGVLALFGALAYAELVAALPHNGGEYQLLGRIYHPAVGFVAAWTSLVVGFSAPIAASAIAFGEYANAALGSYAIHPAVHALLLIVGLTGVHAARVTVGMGFQNAVTALKVLLILAFIVGGLATGDLGRIAEGTDRPIGEALLSPELAVGLIYVSFAYTGWNAATYIAGEVREPGRSLPLALLLGTLAVTALYLGLNVIFLAAVPAETLAASESRVGHVAAVGLFGDDAARVLSAIVAAGLVSTVGALIVTGPRVYEAVGRDYGRLAFLGWRRENGGPITAMLLQSVIAIVMAMTATFDELLTYIGVVLSLAAALTVGGVFVLRVREPDLERPYRAWGHPITSIVFVGLMLWMVVASLIERPAVAVVSLGTVSAGLVLYFLVRPR